MQYYTQSSVGLAWTGFIAFSGDLISLFIVSMQLQYQGLDLGTIGHYLNGWKARMVMHHQK